MNRKQKLELTWIGKENRPKLEPRILLEDRERSYHASLRVSEGDHFDNRLIFGDNLLALKALEQEFAGKVKCIFIDPPYNTGSAFEHYDDGVEHSTWLSLMRDRLELLRRLMRSDGSIWICADDHEGHYLKVLCDEVMGRENFISTVIWQKKYTQANDAAYFSDNHDFILVYAASRPNLRLNLLPREAKQDGAYKNPDSDPRGPWKATPLTARSGNDAEFTYTFRNGVVWTPGTGRFSAYSRETLRYLDETNQLWFGKDGAGTPNRKSYLSDVRQGIAAKTIWLFDEVGHNHEARNESKTLNPNDPFTSPKPERLLKRVIHLATEPGDLVVDSFAGSGTTGAVAHKMGRRWIMVELGEHIHTHIIPRMRKVVDSDDTGGITEAVDWKGGGGFRYFRLAPSLLQKDRWGQMVINPEFNGAMLAEAMCKLEGFTYAPSDTVYWQHGRSTESDYIYVTTQHLGPDQLAQLSDEVGDNRTLLVLCAAFRGDDTRYPNLTVKKIPKQVLSRCEWGRDDYSLNVQNLPAAAAEPAEAAPERAPARRRNTQASLFGAEGGE
jgi:adenine-specific DNA-methyltransferase